MHVHEVLRIGNFSISSISAKVKVSSRLVGLPSPDRAQSRDLLEIRHARSQKMAHPRANVGHPQAPSHTALGIRLRTVHPRQPAGGSLDLTRLYAQLEQAWPRGAGQVRPITRMWESPIVEISNAGLRVPGSLGLPSRFSLALHAPRRPRGRCHGEHMRTTKRFTPKVLARFKRQGRGSGTHDNYLPWHRVSRGDPASSGRSHLLMWRERLRELLSDGEHVEQLFASQLNNLEDCLSIFGEAGGRTIHSTSSRCRRSGRKTPSRQGGQHGSDPQRDVSTSVRDNPVQSFLGVIKQQCQSQRVISALQSAALRVENMIERREKHISLFRLHVGDQRLQPGPGAGIQRKVTQQCLITDREGVCAKAIGAFLILATTRGRSAGSRPDDPASGALVYDYIRLFTTLLTCLRLY